MRAKAPVPRGGQFPSGQCSSSPKGQARSVPNESHLLAVMRLVMCPRNPTLLSRATAWRCDRLPPHRVRRLGPTNPGLRRSLEDPKSRIEVTEPCDSGWPYEEASRRITACMTASEVGGWLGSQGGSRARRSWGGNPVVACCKRRRRRMHNAGERREAQPLAYRCRQSSIRASAGASDARAREHAPILSRRGLALQNAPTHTHIARLRLRTQTTGCSSPRVRVGCADLLRCLRACTR